MIEPIAIAQTDFIIDSVLPLVQREMAQALIIHNGAPRFDPVRLAGLVCEEAGEAMRDALNATRNGITNTDTPAHMLKLREELAQTASMAMVAMCVITKRMVESEIWPDPNQPDQPDQPESKEPR